MRAPAWRWKVAAFATAALAAGCAMTPPGGPQALEDVCEFARGDDSPEGLSSVSRIAGDRYYCVNDRGGMLYEVEIALSPTGDDGTFAVRHAVKLEGCVDLEGCAYDPLTHWVWVSDEHDSSIRAFDPKSGVLVAKASVPAVYREHSRSNRSLEGLAISPDGRRMYAVNEDTLACDGEPANAEHGGLVRIQEFVRADSADPWRPTRQFRYATDAVGGETYKGMAVSGVSSLCAPGGDRLFVLEREVSVKKGVLPMFRCRIYEVSLPPGAPGREPVAKRLLWDENTMFANYEGLSLGPDRPDGTCTFVLMADAGSGADANVLFLSGR